VEAALPLCQIGLLDVPGILLLDSKESGRRMFEPLCISKSFSKCSSRWGTKSIGLSTILLQFPQLFGLSPESIGSSRLVPFN
jgi:hypothetical protein